MKQDFAAYASHRYTDYVGRGFPSGITVDFHMVYTRYPVNKPLLQFIQPIHITIQIAV